MNILIINSRGHWLNGWMAFEASQETIMRVLTQQGCTVTATEVATPAELDSVLSRIPAETLVWANAYWVNDSEGAEVSLIAPIDRYGRPMVGSDLKTLNLLLEKDSCQKRLQQAGIPIPPFVTFQNGQLGEVRAQLEQSGLTFPLVVKPTRESRSHGVTKVNDMAEAVATVHAIANAFPFSNVIVEEFLPTEDITCGYLRLYDEIIILPSFNYVKGMDCTQEVFGAAHYQLPPEYEHQVIIEDQNILRQLVEILPRIADLLGVVGVTRIDARLDSKGELKVFDVNGMPGLNYPTSALIKQCFSHFRTYPRDYVFECLLNTLLLENFQRHGMLIPPLMQYHNLFRLQSETILKLRTDVGAGPAHRPPTPKKSQGLDWAAS